MPCPSSGSSVLLEAISGCSRISRRIVSQRLGQTIQPPHVQRRCGKYVCGTMEHHPSAGTWGLLRVGCLLCAPAQKNGTWCDVKIRGVQISDTARVCRLRQGRGTPCAVGSLQGRTPPNVAVIGSVDFESGPDVAFMTVSHYLSREIETVGLSANGKNFSRVYNFC